jgi:hypothetical protein
MRSHARSRDPIAPGRVWVSHRLHRTYLSSPGRFARPDAFRRGIGSVVPGMEGREANDVYLEQSSLSDVLPFLDAITEDGCQKGDGGQVKRELRQALPNVEKDRVHGKWKESRAARPASPRVLGPELR